MKKLFLPSVFLLSFFCIAENMRADSPEEFTSETAKNISEVKALVQQALSGTTENESKTPLQSAETILQKSVEKSSALYEEFSAKRKSLSEKSPLYQQHLDLEADLYSLKRDLSEVRRDIEHALHAESAKDVEYHLKKTEKSFLEIEKMLKAITLQLQTFKQN